MRRPETAGGGLPGGDIAEPVVELVRRGAAVPDLVAVEDRLHQPVEPLAGKPRDADDRHALDLRQPLAGLPLQLADAAGAAVAPIPLADGDHQRAAFALDQIADAQILLLERMLDVHQHHTTSAKRMAWMASATESFSSFSCTRGGRRMPAVSCRRNAWPCHCSSTAMASRVMPASGR